MHSSGRDYLPPGNCSPQCAAMLFTGDGPRSKRPNTESAEDALASDTSCAVEMPAERNFPRTLCLVLAHLSKLATGTLERELVIVRLHGHQQRWGDDLHAALDDRQGRGAGTAVVYVC